MAGGTRLASILFLSVFLFVRAQNDIREPPKILEPASAKDLFYGGGEDVTLQCRATGQPTPQYEWHWNGAPIESTKQAISYDPSTGILTIKGLTTREEGYYNCRARNTFPNGISAVAISHKIEVRRARIEPWEKDENRNITATEGNYVSITCSDTLPKFYGPTTFKWYLVEGDDDFISEVEEDDRIFIDSKGTLHFVYVLRTDGQSNRFYSCAMLNMVEMHIILGGRTRLVVQKSDSTSPIWVKPLQSTTVPQGKDAVFHCEARSAAGEVPPDPPRWFKNGQRLDVTYDPNKFAFANEKRELRVKSAQKNSDIACFQCYVGNSVGEEFSDGCLNVILRIEFIVQPLPEQTIEKGDIVDLTVVAMADKLYPLAYKWHFKNTTYEQTRAPPYVIYDVNTNLAYINTSDLTDQQMRDIRGVYRRQVYNKFETVFVDVDVKLKVEPITIITRPPAEQTIEKGDIVNLTVVATSDKLYPVAYKWYFNNTAYEGVSSPPHVIYDVNTNLAYINTSDLTDQQMRDIRGVYRRQVYHEFETVFVDVDVKLKARGPVDKIAPDNDNRNIAVIAVLGVVIGVLLLVIVLLAVLYKRKGSTGKASLYSC